MIFISTPNTGRPALPLIAMIASGPASRCFAFGTAAVPSGLISVIPQPWTTVMPCRFSNASIKAGGTPDRAPPRGAVGGVGGRIVGRKIRLQAEPHRRHAEAQRNALGLEQLVE